MKIVWPYAYGKMIGQGSKLDYVFKPAATHKFF